MIDKVRLCLNAFLGLVWPSIAPPVRGDIRPVYRPFAFVDIRVLQGNGDVLFDDLTGRIKWKATINLDDDLTRTIVQSFGERNPDRLMLQYAEKDGAKVSLGQATTSIEAGKRGAPYVPDVPYVTFILGYGELTLPQQTIFNKVAELMKDAEDGCRETATRCAISHRLVQPTKSWP